MIFGQKQLNIDKKCQRVDEPVTTQLWMTYLPTQHPPRPHLLLKKHFGVDLGMWGCPRQRGWIQEKWP